MEIGVRRCEKILILGAERRALTIDDMPLHAVWVELRAEEIAVVSGTKRRAAIPYQAGRRDAGELRHHGHQVASALEFAHHGVPFGIDTAFHEMQQRVTLAIFRVSEIRHGADGFAGRCKHQLDWIIEATAGERFEARAIRSGGNGWATVMILKPWRPSVR